MKTTQKQTSGESRSRLRKTAMQAKYRLGRITAAQCNAKTLATLARDVADGRRAKQ